MRFNNAAVVRTIGNALDSVSGSPSFQSRHPRRRVSSDPCLPERLPTNGFIQREAAKLAPQELTRQLLRDSMDEIVETPTDTQGVQPEIKSPTRSPSYIRSFVKSMVNLRLVRPLSTDFSKVQAFEVMKAVEDRDIMFLMEVRDKAFPLLLHSSGGQTPLVHAMRIGHKDVAIILLGAFSRWVNRLEDDDVQKPQTQSLLKTLRVGLKIAINEGLAKSQSDLIASFLQTLIMSEGDKWVFAQVATVSRALNSGSEGKPVQVAGEAVRKFTTRELGKAELIASLEDYIANATADLLLLGAWSNVLQTIVGEPQIPSSYFARDDRVYKTFVEKVERRRSEIERVCSRRLRWQLAILKDFLDGRTLTFRRKIELLTKHLDNGDF